MKIFVAEPKGQYLTFCVIMKGQSTCEMAVNQLLTRRFLKKGQTFHKGIEPTELENTLRIIGR